MHKVSRKIIVHVTNIPKNFLLHVFCKLYCFVCCLMQKAVSKVWPLVVENITNYRNLACSLFSMAALLQSRHLNQFCKLLKVTWTTLYACIYARLSYFYCAISTLLTWALFTVMRFQLKRIGSISHYCGIFDL